MTRYCPAPDCPARRRSGEVAEYQESVERCADCGAELVAEAPQTVRRRRPWPAALKRRLWVTALGVALASLASLLPSPFVDLESACEALRTSWPRLSQQLGPFALGILPLFSAFVLVELAALSVPRWNRRRHGDPVFRHTLLLRSLTLGFVLAMIQGYFIAVWLEHVGNRPDVFALDLRLISQPGLSFRLQYALTASTGTLLLGLVALVITKHGVGNGFAVLLLVDLFNSVPLELYDLRPMLAEVMNVGVLVFGSVLLFFLLGGIAFIFLRSPRLTPDGLPLFLPTAGLLPLELGMPLLILPPTLLTFVDHPWLRYIVEVTAPGSTTQLYVGLGAVLVSVPLGSWLYWWRFRARLRPPPQRRAWIRAQLLSIALFCALLVLWHGFGRHAPPEITSRFSLLWLIPVVAILGDLYSEIQARRQAPDGNDLIPLAEYQHPAEAHEDARGRSSEAGAVVQGLRFRALHYFFAPQVPCRVLGVEAAPPPASVEGSAEGDGKSPSSRSAA